MVDEFPHVSGQECMWCAGHPFQCSCTVSLSGESGGVTEPGEDHVLVLSVHGDVHGASAVCCEYSFRAVSQIELL